MISGDESESLVALLPRSVAAVIDAQRDLDTIVTQDERRSGTRFWLTSIPAADLRLEFGLSLTTTRGLFVPRRTNSTLRHLVSLTIQAIPEPIDPPPAGGWSKAPPTLFEPAFMVDIEREIDLGLSVCQALRENACTIKVPDPDRFNQASIVRAGQKLAEKLVLPGDPHLGVVAFHVSDTPATDLVVIVTDKAKKDGVFLVEAGQPPVVYSIPDDGNDAMLYEPLHALTLALGRWLAGELPRQRSAVQQLPREWGFSTLELFANNLTTGYEQCVERLAVPRSLGPLTQQFDVARVLAEVRFAIRQQGAPAITIASDTDSGGNLIHGQVAIELERGPSAISTTLTLLAPGFVLSPTARDGFVRQAQDVAEKIAKAFRDDRAVDYFGAVKEPSDAARIVVLLSAEKADDPFKYIATWPIRDARGRDRHFVFRCREIRDALDDFEPVMFASEDVDAVSVGHAPGMTTIDGDVYEEYSRFFRAARVWRSGLAGHMQRAALESH